MKRPIYMDHQTTTPIDGEVLEGMMPYLTDQFGDPSSRSHAWGWAAEEAVDRAREQVATLIGAQPEEIFFTSGATESDNLALKGIAHAYREQGQHIITQSTEHRAVLDSCRALEKEGFAVTYLPVDRYGSVDPEAVRDAITERTILVSIMHANNEVGTIQPLAEIGQIVKARGILFHSDAVQTVGKIACDVDDLQLDLLSVSAHKMYGPKGVGALYVRKTRPRRIKLTPLFDGGGHERGLRSGTLNVPGIVGLGKACEIGARLWPEEGERHTRLRERFISGIFQALDHLSLNGHPAQRLPNNINLSFAGIDGEALIMGMTEVACSSGSACTSTTLEPSYVLKAMGLDDALVHASIRFGLGRWTTEAEVDVAVQSVVSRVKRLREMSPQYGVMVRGVGPRPGR
ncbi:MAG TPA: IscS subfamily cysteine desulfurase [Candidatus Tectomicrobia bacterium]|nr:IscS subfamily cysteine desulfurase [Candidatus Tectomicrobia bacterium]